MEYETWVQLTSQIYQIMINLKKAIISLDVIPYSVYLAAYVTGRYFKIKELSISNLTPFILALFMCELAYSIMISPSTQYPQLAGDMKSFSTICFLFYLQLAVYFVKEKNLWVTLSCSLMCAYMLLRRDFWSYVEIHGQAYSKLLYDVHWLAVCILHCFIVCSLIPRSRYKAAYRWLRCSVWR